jgi:DNA repair protein RecO (recombination protein O)
MSSSQQTLDALVLSLADIGEEDRIVTLLTREHGLLRAAAAGARSLKKGRTAPIDLFVRTRIQVAYRGKQGRLARIRSAEVVEPYLFIRENYNSLCAASYMSELVIRSVQENDPVPGVYELMMNSLKLLKGEGSVFKTILAFELRLLKEMGWNPELEKCLKCGDIIKGNSVFNPREGGVLHVKCAGQGSLPQTNAGDLASLKFITNRSFPLLSNLKLKESKASQLFRIVHPFTTHHLGFEPRAIKVLKNLPGWD